MVTDQIIAPGVKENGETPGIAKGDQVGFFGKIVNGQGLEAGTTHLLLRLSRRSQASMQLRIQQARPDQEAPFVPPPLKIGHETVDNMGLRGEKVDGVHGWIHVALLLNVLDI